MANKRGANNLSNPQEYKNGCTSHLIHREGQNPETQEEQIRPNNQKWRAKNKGRKRESEQPAGEAPFQNKTGSTRSMTLWTRFPVRGFNCPLGL